MLEDNNIRVELDDRDEKLGYKMREAQTRKIPYILVLGDKEKESRNISYRQHGKTDTINMSINDFISKLVNGIKEHRMWKEDIIVND